MNCPNCGNVLNEEYKINVEGKLYGITITDTKNKTIKKEKLCASVCNNCGTVILMIKKKEI